MFSNFRALKTLGTLIAVMVPTCLSTTAFAATGDTFLAQRAGYAMSSGDLTRDKNHLSHMLTLTRSYHGPTSFLSADFMHRFSVLYDSFYTLGESNLIFPFLPHAQLRVIEPSIHFEMCLFTTRRIRPCVGAGLSAVYVQNSIQNYQIYAAAPAEVRFLYANPENVFFVEVGARYRAFQNRSEGYIARHEDITPFLGIGIYVAGEGY